MGERPTIAFRVDESQKERWEEFAEENDEYDSLSHLLRVSVAHEMSDHYGPEGQGGGVDGQQVGKLVTTVEKMDSKLEDLEEQLENATRAINAGGGVSESTLSDVYDALPTAPERATTAEGIAEGLDVDAQTTRVALDQLHETTAAVEKREIQQVEEGEGTKTITDHQGRELEIEDTGTAIRRRNPLWYKRE